MCIPKNSRAWSDGESISKGNTNFAYAGAKIKSKVYPITSVEEQIAGSWTIFGNRDESVSFLRYKIKFTDKDLIFLWGGANDYLIDIDSGKKWIDKITDTSSKEQGCNIEKIISLGGKNILVMNLPDIGKAPLVISEEDATYFSKSFNKKL